MGRTRRRAGVVAVGVALALLAGACVQPPVDNGYFAEPEYCPYDASMVQFNGDSVGFGFARRVRLPPGYSKFEAAQGASTWTIDVSVPTISTRVKQFIEQCGNPGAVVIEGGVIDLTRGVPVETLAATVGELSDWLEARGIPTVWMAIIPMPISGGYVAVDPARLAYNEWLTTPGSVWGTTVDCTVPLQDPARPGWLAPEYWKIVDLFGTPDGIHPADTGYEVMARCIEPAIYEALGIT